MSYSGLNPQDIPIFIWNFCGHWQEWQKCDNCTMHECHIWNDGSYPDILQEICKDTEKEWITTQFIGSLCWKSSGKQ